MHTHISISYIKKEKKSLAYHSPIIRQEVQQLLSKPDIARSNISACSHKTNSLTDNKYFWQNINNPPLQSTGERVNIFFFQVTVGIIFEVWFYPNEGSKKEKKETWRFWLLLWYISILIKNSDDYPLMSTFQCFPAEGFLHPGTQVRQFGCTLNAMDDFFAYNLDANL